MPQPSVESEGTNKSKIDFDFTTEQKKARYFEVNIDQKYESCGHKSGNKENDGMDNELPKRYFPSEVELSTSKDEPKISCLLGKIVALTWVNCKLRCDLQRSERIRKEMEIQLNLSGTNDRRDDLLAKVMNMNWARSLGIKGDQHIGLLLDLSHEKKAPDELNLHLADLNHVPRVYGEHPVVIFSERELETVSYPIDDTIKSHLAKTDEAICGRTNITGHIEVGQDEIAITSGFVGGRGNLAWVNTGNFVICLSLQTGKENKFVFLDPGFGFCVGKRERHTIVFLSIYRAKDTFCDSGGVSHQAHSTFFG